MWYVEMVRYLVCEIMVDIIVGTEGFQCSFDGPEVSIWAYCLGIPVDGADIVSVNRGMSRSPPRSWSRT